MQLSHYALAAALVAVGVPATAAQLFKCAGTDDKVTYQDVPCPTTAKTTTLTVDPRPRAHSVKVAWVRPWGEVNL